MISEKDLHFYAIHVLELYAKCFPYKFMLNSVICQMEIFTIFNLFINI